MSLDYKLYRQDILDAIDKIERYASDLNLERFQQDELWIDAINMNLLIIGEAANAVPTDVQQRHAAVDWRNIIGLRNILAHEYFRLNLDRIWNVIAAELPPLKQQIEQVAASET